MGDSVASRALIGNAIVKLPAAGKSSAFATFSTMYFPAPSIALWTGKPSLDLSGLSVSIPRPAMSRSNSNSAAALETDGNA